MINSKTINTVTKFYDITGTENKSEISEDDKFFACNIGVELAKNIIQEFGENEAIKMANIILSIIK